MVCAEINPSRPNYFSIPYITELASSTSWQDMEKSVLAYKECQGDLDT